MARTSRKGRAGQRAGGPGQRIYCAGGYARLSVEDERHRDRHTLENQINVIRDFVAQQPDIRLCGLYTDDGESGVSLDRPGFQRLMADVKSGKIDCIVVKDLSRFARNFREAGRYLERIFPFLGVRFIAVSDGWDTARPNPAREGIALPGANLVNEMYARDIAQKVNSSLAERRKRGEFLGSKAPYGYRKSEEDRHRLVPDEPAASVVRDIFRWLLEGWGDSRIVGRLNELGVPPPGRCPAARGTPAGEKYGECRYWNKSAIKKIAGSRVYAGDMVQGKTARSYFSARRGARPEEEWIVVENTHEPLVDRAAFQAVQELLEARRRKQMEKNARGAERRKENLLLKKVFCGDCGKTMERRWYAAAGGTRRYEYRCRRRTETIKNACPPKTAAEHALMEALRAAVQTQRALAAGPGEKAEGVGKPAENQGEWTEMEKTVKALRQKISRNNTLQCGLYGSYMQALLTKEAYLQAKERSRRENAAIEGQLEELMGRKALLPGECSMGGTCPVGAEHPASIPEEVLAGLVRRIDVYQGHRVEITLSVTDETRLFAGSGNERGAAGDG